MAAPDRHYLVTDAGPPQYSGGSLSLVQIEFQHMKEATSFPTTPTQHANNFSMLSGQISSL